MASMLSESTIRHNREMLDKLSDAEWFAVRLRNRISGRTEEPNIVFLDSASRLTELAISADSSIKRESICGHEYLYFIYGGIRYQTMSGVTR